MVRGQTNRAWKKGWVYRYPHKGIEKTKREQNPKVTIGVENNSQNQEVVQLYKAHDNIKCLQSWQKNVDPENFIGNET